MLTIREMPNSERPLYRATHFGLSALSNIELIQLTANFLSLETAADILALSGSLTELSKLTKQDLCSVDQVGPSSALSVLAALELGKRMCSEVIDDNPQIRCPADAAYLVMPEMRLLEQEQLRVITLDSKNRVISIHTVFVGSVNCASFRAADLFRQAIKENAVSVIIVHNHPSGDPTPSPDDVRATEKLVEAGDLLDVKVVDHMIIGNNRWVSLKERLLGFR